MNPFMIDGQRQPREPQRRIDLLDSAGIDLRMMPQPLVFEQTGFDDFIAAGGWVATVPSDLE